MRTLRWVCGVIQLNKISNECIRRSLGVTNITGKTRENSWFRRFERVIDIQDDQEDKSEIRVAEISGKG